MVIDFHTHIFPPQIKKDRSRYLGGEPLFAELYSDEKARLATAEELIESMDRDGVDVSVALNIGWKSHEVCVETNDYIMESVARYPKRLIGFCAIPPGLGEKVLVEIERCARGGIKGIGELRPGSLLLDPENREIIEPFMDAVRQHNLILLLHASEPVGHRYPGKGAVTPEKIYPFIEAYPGVTIVCAHWGGGLPFYALMPEVKKAMANVYFDTAASPYLYTPQVYKRVGRLVGFDKILFGSDYPLLAQSRLLKEIRALNLPAENLEKILSGNARRLLNI
jgi:predicted TIM-barrel fold metal-dependent hydrolase